MADDTKRGMSRRSLLKAGAGGALGGFVASEEGFAEEDGKSVERDVYGELGVRQIINAAGVITTLGGSLMPAEVLAAWNAAAKSFVNLEELESRVGEKIAKLLGVEAALVTTGAAGAIVVGAAAAVTLRDRSFVGRLPLPPDTRVDVIRQKTHRLCYDNLVTATGAHLVDVETRADLERAISPRTALMFSYNVYESRGKIRHREWIEVARSHGIPTFLDAASDTPPLDRLWKYNQMGYDMVAFSGGKAILGPQGTGLLLGRKDLIEAAKLNTAPRCGNIGRGMKVSKEDMVAMWAAVERYVNLDHDAEWQRWERHLGVLEDALKDIPTVSTKRVVPPVANHVPHLLIFWDEKKVRMTRAGLRQELARGEPSIVTASVYDWGDGGFLVSVFLLKPGEDKIVAGRLREILKKASKESA